jgi:hypothetical protein
MIVFLYDGGVSVLVFYLMGFGRSVSLCYNGVKDFVGRYYCMIVVQMPLCASLYTWYLSIVFKCLFFGGVV